MKLVYLRFKIMKLMCEADYLNFCMVFLKLTFFKNVCNKSERKIYVAVQLILNNNKYLEMIPNFD